MKKLNFLFFLVIFSFCTKKYPTQNEPISNYTTIVPKLSMLEINGEVYDDSLAVQPKIHIKTDMSYIKIEWKKDSITYYDVDSVKYKFSPLINNLSKQTDSLFSRNIFYLEERKYLQFYPKDIIFVTWSEDLQSDTILYLTNFNK